MAEKGVVDVPMDSVTTAGEDGLPQEMSAMESVAVTTEPAIPGDEDPWGVGNIQDSLMSPSEEGTAEGSSAQALATARAHLAAVAEELATMQNHFVSSSESPARSGGDDVDTEAEDPARGAVADAIKAKQEAELERRHLEVDLECANAKAERLGREKEELLGAHMRMEAAHRDKCRALEEARLRLQHRDLDLRKPGDSFFPLQESPTGATQEKPTSVPLKDIADQAGLAPRPAINLSKQHAVAALRAAQAELREERKRRERLERRVQKDKERLERLVAVAENQQAEIRTLQARCLKSEASAQECFERLQETAAHSSALHLALHGARPTSRGSNVAEVSGEMRQSTPPFGGRPMLAGGGAPSQMVRQQSAPTRLPNVVAAPSRG
jgi:hypothetical protein